MLRQLSTVLVEMQEALAPFNVSAQQEAPGIRLHDANLELPVDLRIVFADGGPLLEADVPRSYADSNWRDGCSHIRLTIAATPWTDSDLTRDAP
jgi:hypothetical protein